MRSLMVWGNIRSICQMEFVWSCKADIFRLRHWCSEVSPNSYIIQSHMVPVGSDKKRSVIYTRKSLSAAVSTLSGSPICYSFQLDASYLFFLGTFRHSGEMERNLYIIYFFILYVPKLFVSFVFTLLLFYPTPFIHKLSYI